MRLEHYNEAVLQEILQEVLGPAEGVREIQASPVYGLLVRMADESEYQITITKIA